MSEQKKHPKTALFLIWSAIMIGLGGYLSSNGSKIIECVGVANADNHEQKRQDP